MARAGLSGRMCANWHHYSSTACLSRSQHVISYSSITYNIGRHHRAVTPRQLGPGSREADAASAPHCIRRLHGLSARHFQSVIRSAGLRYTLPAGGNRRARCPDNRTLMLSGGAGTRWHSINQHDSPSSVLFYNRLVTRPAVHGLFYNPKGL